MSLGNLSIKVSADVGSFVSSMDIAAKAAQSGMGSSAGSVDDFRASLLQASADMQKVALSMGGNMQAANDAIASSSDKAAEAVQGVADAAANVDTRSMGEKFAESFGTGMGVGIVAAQTTWEKFTDWLDLKSKAVSIGIGLLLAGTVAGTIYTVYKLSGMIASALESMGRSIGGMMDGTFFKSENVDSLIASNKELLDLQSNLRISSVEAGALNEAMKRLGVDKGDYKSVYEGVTKAIHTNGEELDRIGVKYKDASGNLLENGEVIKNVKAVLDTYTEGWDRNQAAAAIGIGSYEKISSTLKVTTAEVQTSKERLDDYQLGMSAGTQEMVAKYETAMREFSRENDLAAQGFKRVYADAVMPIYTDMANLFKEGWPSMVQATRIGVASIMAGVYAMADGIYIAKEAIKSSFDVIGNGLGAVAAASVLFMSGDFAGAKNTLVAGWDDTKERLKKTGADIVDQIMHNHDSIKTAFAADGRDASIAEAKLSPVAKLKTWVAAKPEEKAAAAGPLDDVAKRIMEGKLKAQEDFIADEKTQLQTREQFLKSYYADDSISASHYYTASQGLIKDNLSVVQAAYDKEISAIQEYIQKHKAESDKKADIVAAENKITEIRRKKSQEEIATNRDLALSYMSLASERTSIANSLLNANEAENAAYAHRTSVLTADRDAQLQNAIEGNKLLEKEEKRHQEATIIAALKDRKTAMDSENILLQNSKRYADQVRGFWKSSNDTVLTSSQTMAKATANMMTSAADGVASSISQSIVYGKSLGDSLKGVALGVADAFITSFIKMQITKMLLDKTAATSYASSMSLQASAMVSMASLAAFASTAAIPIVGPAAAPAAAAAAAGIGGAFATAVTAFSAASVASAEGGYDIPAGINPMTQLHAKEMVLPAAQADVIRGLSKNGNGGEGMKLTIVNNTSAKIGRVTEQRISANERALIIEDAIEGSINVHAAQLSDPNSKTSRAMSRNFNMPRSR